MHASDLDKAHMKRCRSLKLDEMCDGCIEDGKLFTNPQVVELYRADKVLLTRFDRAQILALLPFALKSTIFVEICPKCITRSNFDDMKYLCRAGQIIPILSEPYELFPAPVVEFVAGVVHVSFWEFELHREESLLRACQQNRCLCHVSNLEKKILARSPRSNVKSRKWTKLEAEIMFQNLHPYIAPDHELLALATKHMRAKRTTALHHLTLMSFAVREVRTAQSFRAALVTSGRELESLPSNIITEADETARQALALRTLAVEGLGLRLPNSVPVHRYVELVREFRRHWKPMIDGVVELTSQSGGLVDALTLCSRLAELNREIERVQRRKRYIVLEAAVGVLRAGLRRAIPIAAATAGVRMLPGRIPQSPSLRSQVQPAPLRDQLVPALLSYLQPYLDKASATFMGSNVLAMQVLSSRRYVRKLSESPPVRSTTPQDVSWHPH